ncbi:MAG: MspA family porin [Rhodococcus sp. (in: high G+C Gram-positive bacteria)]|nr:MspA family porin [Rhodococcus sp. (in: high G+C Gram-positive bacteria)]
MPGGLQRCDRCRRKRILRSGQHHRLWSRASLGSLTINRTQPNTYDIGAGVELALAPGQFNDVKLVADEKSAEIDGVTVATEVSNEFAFDGNGGGYTYADETLSVAGCAGYAEARSYVKVTIDNDAVTATTTLWGQPFSIG